MLALLIGYWISTSRVKELTGARVYEHKVVYRKKVARFVDENVVSYRGKVFILEKRWRGKRLYVKGEQLAPLLFQMGGNWFWDKGSKGFFRGKSSIRFLMGKVGDGYSITIIAKGGGFKTMRWQDSLAVEVRGLYGKYWKIIGDGDFVSFVRVDQYRKKSVFVIHFGPRAGEYSTHLKGDTLRIRIRRLKLKKAERITVVIDPGHGGRDAGAVSNGYMEKDINLAVALKVAEILRRRGYRVIMTRTRDEYVSLAARARLANRSGAHIFVSIHCNASRDPKASGMETYFLSESRTSHERAVAILENSALRYDIGYVKENEPVGAILGDMLQTLLLERSYTLALSVHSTAVDMGLAKDRGVKQAGFYVLKWVMMPSILVELGFITNRGEAKKLADEGYQKKLARAIALGIEKYLKKQGGR